MPAVFTSKRQVSHASPRPHTLLLNPPPATEVEGTFRVNGANKRMRELQALFESPPKYGKNIDWKKEHYTTHDVASVFRRYLTQMPVSAPAVLWCLRWAYRWLMGAAAGACDTP